MVHIRVNVKVECCADVGMAESYKLQFVAGTLTVTPSATGIHNVQGAGRDGDQPTVHNLHGQRVQTARQGLYIVNGRKVVVQ